MQTATNHPLSSILSIAGTDPSGGAGIQADLKAISATGGYAASVITALVAQNTQGVQSILDVPTSFLKQQLDVVLTDLSIRAIKIGMLHRAEIVETIVATLTNYPHIPVIFDPVMVAKDGSVLLELSTIDLIKQRLFPIVSLITPNLVEASHLLDQSIHTQQEMETCAITLGQTHQINVLLKGGHLEGDDAIDVLYIHEQQQCLWFQSKRIETKNTHGTGCSLSAAIASFIGQGMSLTEAVQRAKIYMTHAIQAGAQQQIGQGHGPVDHFYFLENRDYDC